MVLQIDILQGIHLWIIGLASLAIKRTHNHLTTFIVILNAIRKGNYFYLILNYFNILIKVTVIIDDNSYLLKE